jgi:hypothetical protein
VNDGETWDVIHDAGTSSGDFANKTTSFASSSFVTIDVTDGPYGTDALNLQGFKVELECSGSVPAPVAGDDTASTDYMQATNVYVLANDSGGDLGIDSVDNSATNASGDAAGSVSYTPGNAYVTYTPSSGFDGDALFSYVVTNSAGADTGMVTVSVAPQTWGTPVTIDEAGFEGAPARGGDKSVPPWRNSGSGNVAIDIESYANLGTKLDAVPDGGTYCLYMNGTGDSIYQVLSSNLAANRIYRLSAVAIDRTDQTFQPSELRMGYVSGSDNGTTGDMIANHFFGENLLTGAVLENTTPVNAPIPSTNDGTTDPDDGYVVWTTEFKVESGHPGVGMPIRIEIVGSGVQSLFDNVSLEMVRITGTVIRFR